MEQGKYSKYKALWNENKGCESDYRLIHISIEQDPNTLLFVNLDTLSSGLLRVVQMRSATLEEIHHDDGTGLAPQMDSSYSVGQEAILLDKTISYTVHFQDNTTGGLLYNTTSRCDRALILLLHSTQVASSHSHPQLKSHVIVGRTLSTGISEGITGMNTFIVG